MKRFNEYLNEDFDPAIFNHDGGISIKDPTVVDAINSNLEVATSCSFRTPYNALEEIRKTLAYYKIFLPKAMFLDQNHGNDVFEISQFGEKMGMNNQGEVVTADDSPLFVYFEWSMNEKGMYDVFASVVDQNDLDEIMSDYEAEIADDETDIQEEMSAAHASKLMYKVKNAIMGDEHKALVKSYISTAQEKTITEEPMPDLKKKMGAKKVSLPNMMKEDDMDKFDDDKPKRKEKVKKYRHETSGKEIMHTGTPPKGYKLVKESEQIDEVSAELAQRASDAAQNKSRKLTSKYMMYSNRTNKDKKFRNGIAKQEMKAIKQHIKFSDYAAKKSMKEENLQELAGKSKEAMKAIKARIEKKHDAEWEATYEKRKKEKLKGSEKTKKEDKSRNDLAKRWLRADKAEKKLKEEQQLDEISKKKLGQYIKAASHDVATKSAATGRYADRANRARDEMKKGDYKNWPQGKKDDEFADKMFKKSWNRRKGIAKAVDKITK